MFSLLWLAVIGVNPVHASLHNLACEINLAGGAYRVGDDGPAITLGPDQIVVRGRLEIGVDGDPPTARWLVRDVDGFEKIFRRESDSLWTIAPDDYLYLLDKDGRVFRHGYFELISREQQVIWRKRPLTVGKSPQIFAKPHGDTPLFGSDALCSLFVAAQAAVLVKTLPAEGRAAVRARLDPQIAAQRAFANDPRRWLAVGREKRLELAIFDEVIEGPLHYGFADETGRVRGARADDAPARLVPWVIQNGRKRRLRAGDRVILLDRDDQVLVDYPVRRVPIEMGVPPKHESDLALLLALARRGRAVVVRRERS